MKILHRAKELKTKQWVYGFFTGIDEFIVADTSRIAIIDQETLCVYTGKNCIKSDMPIFDKDIIRDHKGDIYHVVYDAFYCSYKLKASLIYGSCTSMEGSYTLIGNIIDNEFQEPKRKNEATSKTAISESSQRKSHKEALRGVGLK